MWWYPDWQSRQVLILVDEDFFLFIGEVIKMRDWPPGQPYRQGAIIHCGYSGIVRNSGRGISGSSSKSNAEAAVATDQVVNTICQVDSTNGMSSSGIGSKMDCS
jgi:hypothetical protein